MSEEIALKVVSEFDVYVDPSGYAMANGMRYSGRGPSGEDE